MDDGPTPKESASNYLFVTYAHADAEVVLADMQALRDGGIETWYDDGIPGGAMWRDELARRIRQSSGVVCFISRHSVGSEYCTQEIGFAIDEGKQFICVYVEPVVLAPGLQMSLSHRQALIRYAIDEPAYRDKLLQAARHLATPADHAVNIPETRLLPDVLIIQYEDRKSLVPADFSGRYTIGRGQDCQLKVNSDFISRHHGFIVSDRGAFRYRDQSRNGSVLKSSDGEQLVHVSEVTLPNSGELRIGNVTISFEVSRSSSATGRAS